MKKLSIAVHTGGLERFRSLNNKYSSRKQSFSHKGMIVRTELALLDHNNNLEREKVTTTDGIPRFNKRTHHWVAKLINVSKCHGWRIEHTRQTVEHRQSSLEDVEDITLPDDIPRNIALDERPPKDLVFW